MNLSTINFAFTLQKEVENFADCDRFDCVFQPNLTSNSIQKKTNSSKNGPTLISRKMTEVVGVKEERLYLRRVRAASCESRLRFREASTRNPQSNFAQDRPRSSGGTRSRARQPPRSPASPWRHLLTLSPDLQPWIQDQTLKMTRKMISQSVRIRRQIWRTFCELRRQLSSHVHQLLPAAFSGLRFDVRVLNCFFRCSEQNFLSQLFVDSCWAARLTAAHFSPWFEPNFLQTFSASRQLRCRRVWIFEAANSDVPVLTSDHCNQPRN